jgi:hypothetical protein
MKSIRCSRSLKKMRYLTSFLGRKLVHTKLMDWAKIVRYSRSPPE